MAYAERGAPMPADLYDIGGPWERALVKKGTLVLLNATNFQGAQGAIAYSDEMSTAAEPGSRMAKAKAAEPIKDIGTAAIAPCGGKPEAWNRRNGWKRSTDDLVEPF